MADTRTLQILIEAKDNASSQLKGLNAQLKTLTPAFQTMAVAGTVAFSAVTASLGVMLSKAGEFEQTSIAFETMLGSEEKAIKLLKEMEDFAKVTPFELSGLEEQVKKLLAYGIAEEDVIETTRMLGDISAGVGMDKLPNLTLAFGQVKAATRLTGMELRQFTEAGVPLLAELAKVLKVDVKEVQAMVSAGKVGFPLVEKALANLTGEGGKFYNLMAKQSTTLNGLISNLQDEFDIFLRNEGALFIDMAKDIVTNLRDVVKVISDFSKKNPELVKTLANVALGLTAVIALTGTLGLAFYGLSTALAFLLANPIVFVLTAITGLIIVIGTQLVKLRTEVQNFGQVWQIIWYSIERSMTLIVASIMETWGKLLKALNLGGQSFIDKAKILREGALELALKTEDIRDETRALNAELENEENNASKTTSSIGSLSDSLSLLGDDSEETEEKIEKLNDKIRALYESTVEVGQNYKKEIKSNESSYIEDIVNTVADAEEEKAKLQSELSTLMAEAPVEEVRSRQEELRGLMKEQDEIINTYKDSEMNLDEEVVERRRYLNMNELDQMEYDYKKKQELAKTNYLIETATNLLKIQNYKETIDNMLSVDVSYYTEVIENEKTVTEVKREELETQTQDLKTYLDKQKSLYSSHYSGIGISSPFLNNSDDYVGNKSYYTPKNINNDVESSEKKTVINIDMRGATITDETITDKISNNLLKNLSYSK